ncbi:hypothetical protein MP228_010713 [Amoeboaphelidium protococcarum]|nr:hypothetical protein MP228_010713 [Amoeboaphelidium protococcarum]
MESNKRKFQELDADNEASDGKESCSQTDDGEAQHDNCKDHESSIDRKGKGKGRMIVVPEASQVDELPGDLDDPDYVESEDEDFVPSDDDADDYSDSDSEEEYDYHPGYQDQDASQQEERRDDDDDQRKLQGDAAERQQSQTQQGSSRSSQSSSSRQSQ